MTESVTINQNLEETGEEVTKLREGMSQLRESLLFNLERAIYNIEDMDKLEITTQDLVDQGERFRQGASGIRRRYWWERYKVPLLFGSGFTLSGIATGLFFLL